jgi:16S rRNA (guanine1207-N2)-methyltransferase
MNDKRIITAKIKGVDLAFATSREVFSPRGIDKGTQAMLSVIDFDESDKVCDLGCGYGVVGILAAKMIGPERVVMIDNNEIAVELSRENANINGVGDVSIYLSDGFVHVNEKDFTMSVSHPPYHADFSVPKMFIENGFNRLKLGGRFYMVTKRKDWYKNKLISIFGGVRIWEIDDYYVFMSEKREKGYAKGKN